MTRAAIRTPVLRPTRSRSRLGRPSPTRERWPIVAVLAFAALAIAIPVGTVMTPDPTTQLIVVGAAGGIVAVVVLGLRNMAVASLCAAFALGPMNSVRVAPWLTFGDVALVLAIGLGALASGWVLGKVALPSAYVGGSVVLVLAGLIASFLANDWDSVGNLGLLVFAAVMLPVFGALWRPSMGQVQLLVISYLIGQSASVAYGLVTPVSQITGRVVGLSLRPNHFGLASSFAIGLAVFLFFAGRAWLRWFALAAGSICSVGVFLSGSRAALLAVMVMGVAVALIRQMWKTSALGAVAVGIALLAQDELLALLPAGSALYRLFGDESTEVANASRLEVLTSNFDSFLANPLFGRGFANSLEAHNIYLQVATAAGVVGAIGFVFIVYTAVRPLLRADFGTARWLALPALAYASAGVVSNTLWDRFIWVLLGLSVLLLRQGIPQTDDTGGSDADPAGPGTEAMGGNPAPASGLRTDPR